MSEMPSPIDKSYLVRCWWTYTQTLDTPNKPNIPNIVPVHKKEDKRNSWQLSGKIFKRISISEFLNGNNLSCENHFGFRPSDSCECRLLSIVHDMYKSFNCNPPLDVTGTFLDISKVFERLVYKCGCGIVVYCCRVDAS